MPPYLRAGGSGIGFAPFGLTPRSAFRRLPLFLAFDGPILSATSQALENVIASDAARWCLANSEPKPGFVAMLAAGNAPALPVGKLPARPMAATSTDRNLRI